MNITRVIVPEKTRKQIEDLQVLFGEKTLAKTLIKIVDTFYSKLR